MFGSGPKETPEPSIEDVRKHSRVLVIDDIVFPFQELFERDGYHFERWPDVKNLSQLTDGHFHLILLDIHGVGLKEDPTLGGLGILSHIKHANPSQPVIVYSSRKQNLSSNTLIEQADAVLDKSTPYLGYKADVDRLLVRRASPAYFIAVLNRQLAEDAARAPKAVPKALAAMRRGDVDKFATYIKKALTDPKKINGAISIIAAGIKAVRVLNGA